MFRRNKLYISLEENCVRLLLGRGDGKRVLVEGFSTLSLEEGLGRARDAGDLFAVGERIKNLAQEQGLSAKRYMVVLDRRGIVARTARVPVLKPRLLRDFLAREMGSLLPVDPDEYVSDYAVLKMVDEGDEGSYYQVFLAGVPRYMVEQVGIMAQAWDAYVEAVEVAPRSILRLFRTSSWPDSVVLNLRADGGFVMVIEKGGLLVHADLPFAGLDLVRPEEVAREVRGYLDFYSSRNQGKTIEQVWMAGQAGCDGEWVTRLAEFLPVPVEMLAGPAGLPVCSRRGKAGSQAVCTHAVLLGALLRKG